MLWLELKCKMLFLHYVFNLFTNVTIIWCGIDNTSCFFQTAAASRASPHQYAEEEEEEDMDDFVPEQSKYARTKASPHRTNKTKRQILQTKVIEKENQEEEEDDTSYRDRSPTPPPKKGGKVKSTFKPSGARAKHVEEKYVVDYSKLQDKEWFEKSGASYRAFQGEKKAETKKRAQKKNVEKADDLKSMAQNVLDMGRTLQQQGKDLEPDCPDMLWFKSVLSDFKKMPDIKKARLKVTVMSTIYDALEEL